MSDDSQNNNDFQTGFLIKDRSGRLKKVQEDKIIDFTPKPRAKPAISPSALQEPVKKAIAPPPPPPMADKRQPVVSRPVNVPPPPISSSDQADFIVDLEDEEEIKQHTEEPKKIISEPAVERSMAINAIIEKILRKYNLQFENEVMLKRFSKVLESRIRGLRDSLGIKDVLTRPKKIGGLELESGLVQDIIQETERESQLLEREVPIAKSPVMPAPEQAQQPANKEEPDRAFAPAPPPFVPRPGQPPKEEKNEPIMAEAEEEKPEQLAEEIRKELESIKDKKHEPAIKAPPLEIKASEPAPVPKTEQVEKIKVEAEPASIKKDEPISTPIAPDKKHGVIKPQDSKPFDQPIEPLPKRMVVESSRPQMVDIRLPQKVVGPIEELKDIDLKEFRRLGASPQDSIEKVLEKVYLLEEESWDLKMKGIKAWQESETNKLYIDIGLESLKNGSPVKVVINRRKNEGLPQLSYEEFIAIGELNKKINT